MAVDTKHPLYAEHIEDWELQRDSSRSERVVKEAGFKYLPPTAGMRADGIERVEQDGFRAYTAYRMRARYPELFTDAIESMLGVMHNKPPVIEVPAQLEPMLEQATLRRESLEALLRRINEEQLKTGRLGLLLDIPPALGATVPYIALYEAEDIINWDVADREEVENEILSLVVLDESEEERIDGFDWEMVEKYRVLSLGPVASTEPEGTYSVVVVRRDSGETMSEASAMEPVEPAIAGQTLDEIPFVFVNTKDIVPDPDEGPLLGLANLCMTIYRGEADYRQSLFMQGQDTLVTIGATGDEDESRRVGSGAEIALPQGGDAKFIGVGSEGLAEQRQALENDYARGEQRANGLLETTSRAAESGDALSIRVSARTASLNQIALTGAFAVEQLLKTAARWVGANPDEVVVTPNLDFVDDTMAAQEVVQLQTAKGLGAPLSLESIHKQYQDRGLTEMTFEEEQAAIQAEIDAGITPDPTDVQGATDEGAPEEDADDADAEDADDNADAANAGA